MLRYKHLQTGWGGVDVVATQKRILHHLGLDNFSRVELAATYQMFMLTRWKELKKNIPNGLTTQSPWLLVYARSWISWQWRYIMLHQYVNMCKNTLKTTAKAVRQALLG